MTYALLLSEEEEAKIKETFPNLPIPKKAFETPTNEIHLKWSNPELNWSGEDIVKVLTEITSDSELLVSGIIVNMDSFALMRFLSKNRISSEKEIKFNKDKKK